MDFDINEVEKDLIETRKYLDDLKQIKPTGRDNYLYKCLWKTYFFEGKCSIYLIKTYLELMKENQLDETLQIDC